MVGKKGCVPQAVAIGALDLTWRLLPGQARPLLPEERRRSFVWKIDKILGLNLSFSGFS